MTRDYVWRATPALARSLLLPALLAVTGLALGRADLVLLGVPLAVGTALALGTAAERRARRPPPEVRAIGPRILDAGRSVPVAVRLGPSDAQLVATVLPPAEAGGDADSVAVAAPADGERQLVVEVTAPRWGAQQLARPDHLAAAADGLLVAGPVAGPPYTAQVLPAVAPALAARAAAAPSRRHGRRTPHPPPRRGHRTARRVAVPARRPHAAHRLAGDGAPGRPARDALHAAHAGRRRRGRRLLPGQPLRPPRRRRRLAGPRRTRRTAGPHQHRRRRRHRRVGRGRLHRPRRPRRHPRPRPPARPRPPGQRPPAPAPAAHAPRPAHAAARIGRRAPRAPARPAAAAGRDRRRHLGLPGRRAGDARGDVAAARAPGGRGRRAAVATGPRRRRRRDDAGGRLVLAERQERIRALEAAGVPVSAADPAALGLGLARLRLLARGVRR